MSAITNGTPYTFYTAATPAGEYIEGGYDLVRLVRILRDEILQPDGEDCIITLGPRVAAVIQGGDKVTYFRD